MYIRIYPGAKNQALIDMLNQEISIWEESDFSEKQREKLEDKIYGLMEEHSTGDVMDALYYACNRGDKVLEEQADYFFDCLLGDECAYYIDRVLDKMQ